ncbi:MAG: hypothetical protein ACOCU0_02900 [Bacillota bacterium]
MMTRKLIRVFFKENLSFSRLLGFDVRRSKIKAVLIGLALLYAVATFFGLLIFMFFDLAELLGDSGMGGLVLSFLFTYFIGLTFLIVFLRSNGYLFYYKDFDILGALPLDPRTIFQAKLALLMVFVYLSALIMTLPIIFSYFYHVQFSFMSLLMYILAFAFIPLLPLVLVTIVSLAIAKITARFKRSKLISTLLLFTLFFAGMGFFMSFSNVEDANPLLSQQAFIRNMEGVYPPMLWFREAIHEQKVLSIVYLMAFNGIPFYLFIRLMPPFVHRLNQKGLKSKVQTNGRRAVSKARPVYRNLVMKEFKKMLDVPMYALNAALGPLLLLILPIAALFFKDSLESLFALEGMTSGIQFSLAIFFGFSIVMSYSPAVSLSLEGKKFWILRSLPLEARTILLSKVVFNLFLTIPFGLIGLLILGNVFAIGFLNMALLALIIISLALASSLWFSVLNMLMPKFHFSTETEVIKQSASAFLAIFGGFALLGGEVYLYFKLVPLIGDSWVWVALSLINGILAVLAYLFIHLKSEAYFKRYNA